MVLYFPFGPCTGPVLLPCSVNIPSIINRKKKLAAEWGDHKGKVLLCLCVSRWLRLLSEKGSLTLRLTWILDFQTWRKIAQKRGLKFDKHFGKVSKVWKKGAKCAKKIVSSAPPTTTTLFCEHCALVCMNCDNFVERILSYYLVWISL